MPETGGHRSPYNVGEAKALIAPLLGCSAEEIGQLLIIARDSTLSKIGAFHTMYCSQEIHDYIKGIDLAAEYIQDAAMRIYERTPQHGPGE